ncbi:hypothetical protein [Sorangium sp. So ce1024]|uniref:hypothetical protein n=1 Tax=Sorangium sp. So ce1024 TaxID=3133327 RepID=UPI003F046633
MSLDDAIKAAEQAAERLRETLAALEHEAVAAIGACPHDVRWAQQQTREMTFSGVRRALAEARRPKGPMVMLEHSREYGGPRAVEVVRRTEKQVIVAEDGYVSKERYKVDTGYPTERGGRFLGVWRIREADLATIRAMPIGENAVSRALKAIEAGRLNKVKP